MPAEVQVWVGFWRVLEVPSPKDQLQEVGEPVDVSESWTDWPTVGEAGVKVNAAVGAMAARTMSRVLRRQWEKFSEPLLVDLTGWTRNVVLVGV